MEKEKLPQFVIDELKKYDNNIYRYNKERMLLIHDIYEAYIDEEFPKNVDTWLRREENRKKLIRALVNGYEVEKEQLYYVKLIDSEKGYLNELNGKYFLSTKHSNIFKVKFTKNKIKEINTAYWNYMFLEKVDMENE